MTETEAYRSELQTLLQDIATNTGDIEAKQTRVLDIFKTVQADEESTSPSEQEEQTMLEFLYTNFRAQCASGSTAYKQRLTLTEQRACKVLHHWHEWGEADSHWESPHYLSSAAIQSGFEETYSLTLQSIQVHRVLNKIEELSDFTIECQQDASQMHHLRLTQPDKWLELLS